LISADFPEHILKYGTSEIKTATGDFDSQGHYGLNPGLKPG